MKSQICTVLAATLLLFSTLAGAAPQLELIWVATTGAGTTGSNVIRAQEGDYVRLNIYITGDGSGLVGASLSLYWDPYDLEGFEALECPAGTYNIYAGLCNDGGLLFYPTYPGVTLDFDTGSAEAFDAFQIGGVAGYFGLPMHIGSIEFYVGPGATTEEIQVGYRPGFDTIIDGNFVEWTPEATATILPPCSGCSCPS